MSRNKHCPICGAEKENQHIRSADAELRRRFRAQREWIISNIEKMGVGNSASYKAVLKAVIAMIRRTMKD